MFFYVKTKNSFILTSFSVDCQKYIDFFMILIFFNEPNYYY